jgi:Glycosyl hydrolase family 1
MLIPRRGLLATAVSLFTSRGVLHRSNAEDGRIPEGFVWGASTSSYQIEGAVHNNRHGTKKATDA